jgi:DNA-binding Lrp family transcriptional regulator
VDDIDRTILSMLQDNADLPGKVIAEAVGLSTSAVERRIGRLKQAGVIEKIVAVVSPEAVGRTLSVLVELEIQNEHRHTLVAVRDLAEYNAFIDRLMSEQQALVRKYRSLIALKTVKHGLGLSVLE